MGRIIDADDFFERIKNDIDLCAEMEKDGLKALKKYLDMQPTAYDVNAVVEQIKKEFLMHKPGEGFILVNVWNNALNKAIEIVKGKVN